MRSGLLLLWAGDDRSYGDCVRLWVGDMDCLPDQQVYFIPTLAHDPFGRVIDPRVAISDLVPMIVPPVADKSSFFGTGIMRVVWTRAFQSLKGATDVYCLGYSLPRNDVPVRYLIRSAILSVPPIDRTIHVINTDASSGCSGACR